MVELSIIISTLNEERYLPYLLDSIKKQNFKDYEIIVSDNNSQDKTKLIAKKYGCKIVNGGLPSKARNNGALAARGKYLLFLDADVILQSDFIKEYIEEFKKKNLDVATNIFIPLSEKKIDALMYKFSNNFIYLSRLIKPIAIGGCIFVKKNLHIKIGGFDEKIKLNEDYDYVYRATKIGKFNILKSKKVYVSVRRLEKMGRMNIAMLSTKTTLYHYLGKKILKDDNRFNYEFGCFNK